MFTWPQPDLPPKSQTCGGGVSEVEKGGVGLVLNGLDVVTGAIPTMSEQH